MKFHRARYISIAYRRSKNRCELDTRTHICLGKAAFSSHVTMVLNELVSYRYSNVELYIQIQHSPEIIGGGFGAKVHGAVHGWLAGGFRPKATCNLLARALSRSSSQLFFYLSF